MWNCLSSLPISAIAFYGMIISLRQSYDNRICFAYFTVFIVGLGSAMFHGKAARRPADVASLSYAHAGTLTRLGQAFDELPMIATVNACLYTTMELQAGYVICASFVARFFAWTLTHASAARQTGWKSSPRACVRLTFRRFLHLLRLLSPGVLYSRAALHPLPLFLLSIRCDFAFAFCQLRFWLLSIRCDFAVFCRTQSTAAPISLQYYWIFIITYSLQIVVFFSRAYLLIPQPSACPTAAQKWQARLYKYGAFIYLGGWAFFWMPENLFCLKYPSVFQPLHLHSLFHLTSAVAPFHVLMFLSFAREESKRGVGNVRHQEHPVFFLGAVVVSDGKAK